MNKEQLIKLSDIISELSSLLARQKYYGQILKDMGLPDNGYDSKLIITDNELIKYPAWRISPDNEKDNWQYLEFWENRINEAYNLIGHMSRISESIYDYKAEVIKVPFIVLMMSTIFGMFIPIFSMAVNFIYPTEYFMTYISIVGFTMCFIMMTIFMYKTVASTEIVGY